MNREEKEATIVLGIATAVLVAMCILSFERCAVVLVFATAATLYAFVWGKIFGEALEEVRKRQIQSRDKPRCVTDN